MNEFRDTTIDARQAVPRRGQITLLPQIPGVEFNPERRMFYWLEDFHREEFRLRVPKGLDGTTARGRLSVYLGAVLLAELDLAIKVNSTREVLGVAAKPDISSMTCRPYRKIFASYSHRDTEIVRQFEAFIESSGDRYLRDVRDLRSGEKWDPRLLELIAEADIFQLFWSSNSMRSPYVRREWECALELRRANFIRPTYWEEPRPESADEGLPPEPLQSLHFHRIAIPPVKPAKAKRRPSMRTAAMAMALLLGGLTGLWLSVIQPSPTAPPNADPGGRSGDPLPPLDEVRTPVPEDVRVPGPDPSEALTKELMNDLREIIREVDELKLRLERLKKELPPTEEVDEGLLHDARSLGDRVERMRTRLLSLHSPDAGRMVSGLRAVEEEINGLCVTEFRIGEMIDSAIKRFQELNREFLLLDASRRRDVTTSPETPEPTPDAPRD